MEEDRQSDKERQEVILYIYTHTQRVVYKTRHMWEQ